MAMSFLVGTKSKSVNYIEPIVYAADPDAKEGNPAYTPVDQCYTSKQYISMNHVGNIESVWDHYKGDDVRVAVIDSGFDYDHPDFINESGESVFSINEGRFFAHASYQGTTGHYSLSVDSTDKTSDIVQFAPQESTSGYTFNDVYYPGADCLRPMAKYKKFTKHGTDVVSTLASQAHDSTKTGCIGIAPNIKVIPIKTDFWTDSIYNALNYIYLLNQNASTFVDVVNMSIEAPQYDYVDSEIDRIIKQGTIVIAAAGNHTTSTASYPASSPGAIGVGALDKNSGTTRASYSNYNASTATSSGNNNVDLSAPGSVYTASWSSSDGHIYDETSGTSFASPIVAGAAALWKQANPSGTVDQFKEALFGSCIDIGSSGWDTTFGYGRLDIGALLDISPESPFVNLSEYSSAITKDSTYQISVFSTNGTLSYSSFDTTVASVSNSGLITGLSSGTATIRVTATTTLGSAYKDFSIEVTNPATSASINPDSIELDIGDTYEIDPTITLDPSDADREFLYEVEDESICTVDDYGHVEAVAEGTTTITIAAADELLELTVKVNSSEEETSTGEYTIGWGTATGTAGTYTNFTANKGTVNGILSFSSAKNNSGTEPAYNSSSNELRLYYNSGGNGGSITITPADGITFTSATIVSSTSPTVKYSVDGGSSTSISASNYTYTISNISASSSLKIQNGNTTNTQLRIKTILLTYTVEEQVILSSISISGNYPTTFAFGDTFSYGSMVVTATYSDKTTANVTSKANFSGYNMQSAGTQTVTVSYTENQVTATKTYTITVNSPVITSITAQLKSSKTYYVGETITRNDITVTTNTGVDVTSSVNFADYQFVYSDSNSGGTTKVKTFEIIYESFETTLNVNVQRKSYVAPSSTTSVKDTITASDLPASTTSYTDFSNVSLTSTAKYSGNSAKDASGNIQMRSKNSNSGIVSIVSGGNIDKVVINVGSGSNTIDVYGKNSAYSQATDLYDSSKAGTKIGSVTSTGTITFNSDYSYVGIRSNSGAIYISSISIYYKGEKANDTPENVANYIMFTDTNGQCEDVGETKGKFTIAKGYFENMTKEGRSEFMTSNDYVIAIARERFIEWAKHNHKSITISNDDYVINSTVNTVLNKLVLQGESSVIVIVSSVLCLTAIGGYIFIRKRKES